MAPKENSHEAAGSALGYLYQCRYALLSGLRALPDTPHLQISIEKFDDIAFESNGDPIDLIQTKHHVKSCGDLTDGSVDLWKTLGIWLKRVAGDVEAPFRTKFILVTTAHAVDGSAASYLRMLDRNESTANSLLLDVATKSKNKKIKEVCKIYRDLPEQIRLNLLQSVMILDGSHNILDVREDIVRELRHAAQRDQIETLAERLEGWWFGVVIRAMSAPMSEAIPVLSIEQRVDELREQFKRDALPVDFAMAIPSETVIAELDKRPFVQQLRRIAVGSKRIEYAIRDYYRASEQRSRWAREDLLVDGELESFEHELTEAWEPRHASIVDEAAESSPEQKVALGQRVFTWVEQEASFPLRTVRERFLTHGSYHILANRMAVGWHPEFKTHG